MKPPCRPNPCHHQVREIPAENYEKAHFAAHALYTYQQVTRSDDPDLIVDLIADLHHYADLHEDSMDWDGILDRADYHYTEEVTA